MEQEKKKRKRTIITNEQLESLETSFTNDPWPNGVEKGKLAKMLGKSQKFVSVWFQNRRARLRKEEQVVRKEKSSFKQKGLRARADETVAAHSSYWVYQEETKPDQESNQYLPKVLKDEENIENQIETIKEEQIEESGFITIGIPFECKTGQPFSTMKRQSCGKSKMKFTDFPGLNPEAPTSKFPANPPTLFRCIVNMMAVSEGGGIIHPSHPEFDAAVNDFLYGIKVNDDCSLVYSNENGLEFVE